MIPLEELKQYLPKFLSPASEAELFTELQQFPENIDDRVYTSHLAENELIYQGDGLGDLLVINLPTTKVGLANAMIFSNTCDLHIDNQRLFHTSICYAPIFDLAKYAAMLERRGLRTPQAIADHLAAVRKQRISQIFYLPAGAKLPNESLVLLDRVCHCSNDFIDRSTVPKRRLFTLSNYGIYLFLFKLSVHFTRMADKVDRGAPSES